MLADGEKTRSLFGRLRYHAWVFVLLWTCCIVVSLLWNLHEQEEHTCQLARNNAAVTFENDVLYRKWAAKQGGVYVPVSEQMAPNPYLKVPNRDVTTSSGLSLTLVNPAYMARQVSQMAGGIQGSQGHLTSLKPIRPENSPDPWETAALKSFESGVKEVSSLDGRGDGEHIRLMRPFVTEKACLKCHGSQGYKEGDIRGGISISVPMAPFRAIERSRIAIMSLAHLLLWIIGTAGIVVSKSGLQKQIKVQEKAEEVLRRYELLAANTRDKILFVRREDGRILEANIAATQGYGYSRDEMLGLTIHDLRAPDARKQIPEQMAEADDHGVLYTTTHQRKDGSTFPVEVSSRGATISGTRTLINVIRDITERKQAEQERETTIEFLRLINESTGVRDLIESAVRFFRKQSGFEAIGIRLREGDDYPYYEAYGFPEEFLRLESSLCVRDADGQIRRDHAGNPVMACMCGNVICRQFDPSKPFFTPHGSFWTNDMTRLLAATSEADRQGNARDRCNMEGYESVALIPLNVGEERLGLLQLNDRRKGGFSPEIISLWERLAGHLSVALAKFRTEEALRKQEEQLRELSQRLSYHVDNSPLAVIEWGPDMRLSRWSNEAEHIFGWKAEEVLGKRMEEFRWVYSEDVPQVSEVTADLKQGTNPRRFSSNRNYCKDGSVVHCEWYNSSLLDESGKLRSILSLVLNVTDRKQAEEARHQSLRRFELLAQTAGELLQAPQSRKVVESLCHKLMEYLDCHAFFNFMVDDKAGRLHLNAYAGISPDDARRIEWLEYGAAVCGCVVRDGCRIVAEHIPTTPDERTELVKSYGIKAYACHPLLGPAGKVIGTLSFGSRSRETFSDDDLSLMKAVADQVAVAMVRIQDEQTLRENEARMRFALENSSVGAWSLDIVSQVAHRSVEHDRIFGYESPLPTWTYEKFLEHVLPEDRAEVDGRFHRAVQTQGDWNFECRIRRVDGPVRWIWAAGRHCADEYGNRRLLAGIVQDITERKEIEQERQILLDAERAARTEIEHINRMKDEFLATVSHELRSPLAAIVGWTGLLAKGKVNVSKATEIISQSASGLTQLVEDLLDMSRIISGKIRLKREAVDLVTILNNVVESVQFSAQAKSIHLNVSFDPQLRALECDPNRVQQIVWNLLTNAIKFSPEGGLVVISVSQSHRNVVIRVQDSGQGITPEFLPHIFERFRQQDGGIARRHGGLGLGLAIVKNLVELHGGTIQAESEGEGKGAQFIVTLPNVGTDIDQAAELHFNRPTTQAAVDIDELALRGLKILTVDDDPYWLELADRTLSDYGAVVRTASSAREALNLMDEFRPDVLMSDVGMPGDDGFALVRQVRTAGGWKTELPCIAVTALSRPEDRGKALDVGFDEHVGKPFDPALLCMVVSDLVKSRRANG